MRISEQKNVFVYSFTVNILFTLRIFIGIIGEL